ncbi:MAG TPA: type II toxin-antitoxin system PemK/MazF family toxin [Rhabdochlamydiaceae bacterium]|jgi:mRNA-degrading endonuclease toxin of MazEF toxin-antitoxin module|nr:type II toxin-antitoxin system PemK/MazF family toxin [Rhabdochlamydiaceae bacterium]
MISRPFATQIPNNGLKRGDIVLLKSDFEGKGGNVVQAKNRPSIVISSDQMMKVTKRVTVAPLSTAPARYAFEVVVPNNDLTGIHKPSKVMANQIRTAYLDEGFIKIGSSDDYLPEIIQALATCLGEFKLNQPPRIARGDIVEIDCGSFTRSGIVVSNDIGNRASKIATLVHVLQKIEEMSEFDVVVSKEENVSKEKLFVQCSTINTFPQGVVTKKGRLSENDMQRVAEAVYKVLGIEN